MSMIEICYRRPGFGLVFFYAIETIPENVYNNT